MSSKSHNGKVWPITVAIIIATILIGAITSPAWGFYILDEPFGECVLRKEYISIERYLQLGADVNLEFESGESAKSIALADKDARLAQIVLVHGATLSPEERVQLERLAGQQPP